MAELRQRTRAGCGAARGRHVASLIWPGGLPPAANDNPSPLSRHRLLPMAASLALLLAAVWVVAS